MNKMRDLRFRSLSSENSRLWIFEDWLFNKILGLFYFESFSHFERRETFNYGGSRVLLRSSSITDVKTRVNILMWIKIVDLYTRSLKHFNMCERSDKQTLQNWRILSQSTCKFIYMFLLIFQYIFIFTE